MKYLSGKNHRVHTIRWTNFPWIFLHGSCTFFTWIFLPAFTNLYYYSVVKTHFQTLDFLQCLNNIVRENKKEWKKRLNPNIFIAEHCNHLRFISRRWFFIVFSHSSHRLPLLPLSREKGFKNAMTPKPGFWQIALQTTGVKNLLSLFSRWSKHSHCILTSGKSSNKWKWNPAGQTRAWGGGGGES